MRQQTATNIFRIKHSICFSEVKLFRVITPNDQLYCLDMLNWPGLSRARIPTFPSMLRRNMNSTYQCIVMSVWILCDIYAECINTVRNHAAAYQHDMIYENSLSPMMPG